MRFTRPIVIVVALATATGCVYDTSDVRRLESERQQAMVQADSVALETLLSPRCTYTHSTGLVQSKDEVIALLTSGDVDYVSFDNKYVWYERYGDTWVVTGLQAIELVVRGQPLTSVSRYTVVWAQSGWGPWKSWSCVAYQSTPNPE